MTVLFVLNCGVTSEAGPSEVGAELVGAFFIWLLQSTLDQPADLNLVAWPYGRQFWKRKDAMMAVLL